MRNSTKIRQITRLATVLGLSLALGLLAACAAEPKAAKPKADPSVAAEVPTVKLVAPTDGATVAAGKVEVTVETTGLEFVMPSNDNVAGQGHVHFTLDDEPFVMSVEKTVQLKDVAPGKHRLHAELVQNNTDSFDPPIGQDIEFIAE